MLRTMTLSPIIAGLRGSTTLGSGGRGFSIARAMSARSKTKLFFLATASGCCSCAEPAWWWSIEKMCAKGLLAAAKSVVRGDMMPGVGGTSSSAAAGGGAGGWKVKVFARDGPAISWIRGDQRPGVSGTLERGKVANCGRSEVMSLSDGRDGAGRSGWIGLNVSVGAGLRFAVCSSLCAEKPREAGGEAGWEFGGVSMGTCGVKLAEFENSTGENFIGWRKSNPLGLGFNGELVHRSVFGVLSFSDGQGYDEGAEDGPDDISRRFGVELPRACGGAPAKLVPRPDGSEGRGAV